MLHTLHLRAFMTANDMSSFIIEVFFSVITELFPNFLTTRQYTYMQLSMYIFIFNSFVQLRLYLQQCLSYTSSLPLYTLINARFHQFVDYCILLM